LKNKCEDIVSGKGYLPHYRLAVVNLAYLGGAYKLLAYEGQITASSASVITFDYLSTDQAFSAPIFA